MPFAIYHDAALTQPANGANKLVCPQASDGSTGAYDTSVYVGSTDTAGSKQLRAASNPGVAQLQIAPVDAAGGSGSPATDIKLSLSAGGLATATGGAALNLGTTILSGVANAVRVYVRVTDSTHAVATNTDISLQIAGAQESAT